IIPTQFATVPRQMRWMTGSHALVGASIASIAAVQFLQNDGGPAKPIQLAFHRRAPIIRLVNGARQANKFWSKLAPPLAVANAILNVPQIFVQVPQFRGQLGKRT